MDLDELAKLTDRQLAEKHAGMRSDEVITILCQHEFQRRIQTHAMVLAEQISRRERTMTIVAAGLGVLGTLLGVALGRWWS